MTNFASIRTQLVTLFGGFITTGEDDTADKFATAWTLGTIGQTTTLFGAPILSADSNTLAQFIASGLKVLRNGDDSGYDIIGAGFSLYYSTVVFSPLPPMPPAVIPASCIVVFPGNPELCATAWRQAFKTQEIGACIDVLISGMQLFLTTITGTYFGSVPTPPGAPVPVVLPWVGLL